MRLNSAQVAVSSASARVDMQVLTLLHSHVGHAGQGTALLSSAVQHTTNWNFGQLGAGTAAGAAASEQTSPAA